MQYRFTFRRVNVSDLVISPELIPLLSQPERVGQFSMTFIQDRRDDPINSHRGMYNTMDVGLALKQFGSETVFTRLLMRNSTYYPIGKDIVIGAHASVWLDSAAGRSAGDPPGGALLRGRRNLGPCISGQSGWTARSRNRVSAWAATRF